MSDCKMCLCVSCNRRNYCYCKDECRGKNNEVLMCKEFESDYKYTILDIMMDIYSLENASLKVKLDLESSFIRLYKEFSYYIDTLETTDDKVKRIHSFLNDFIIVYKGMYEFIEEESRD